MEIVKSQTSGWMCSLLRSTMGPRWGCTREMAENIRNGHLRRRVVAADTTMVVMVAMGVTTVMEVMDTNGALLEEAGRSLVPAAAAAQVAIDSTCTSMLI